MTVLSMHIRCLLLFFILVQSISPYKIYSSDDNHSDLSSSSFNKEINQNMELDDDNDDTILYANNDDNKDTFDQWESKTKRSISSSTGIQSIPQRRNNRPHWNPLVAAYKRCGELLSRDERESCFKDAVQMLFVYKLKK